MWGYLRWHAGSMAHVVLASCNRCFQRSLDKAHVEAKLHSLLTLSTAEVLIHNLAATFPSNTGRGSAAAHLMSDAPALPPPSGTFSDFDNPVSQKQRLIVINSISLCVMLAFVGLHYYTRTFVIRIVGIEDRKTELTLNVR